jgi:hypothetical protein
VEWPKFDLFGHPVDQKRGGRGRPTHKVTEENRNKVKVMVAMGHEVDAIAAALDVSVPTLRKHYFSELKPASTARLRLRADLDEKLYLKAIDGDTSANKELDKRLRTAELEAMKRARADREPDKGKKEAALDAAQNAARLSSWATIRKH